MRIESEFEIGRPPDAAFEFLADLDRVAPCLPGASLGEEREGGARAVTITVRLGPMRMTYEGEVRIDERDPVARRAVLTGTAREARGGGTGQTVMTMSVLEGESGSRVEAVSEVTLTGRAAQMGQGVVQEVARQMVQEMAGCIEARMAAELPPAEALDGAGPGAQVAPTAPPPPAGGSEIKGGTLLWRVLVARIKGLFSRRQEA